MLCYVMLMFNFFVNSPFLNNGVMMSPKRRNIISLAFTSGVSLNQYKYQKMGVTSYQTKKIHHSK